MKLPLSWIREYVPVPLDISMEELESAFVKVGFEIESIEIQGSDLSGPLIVAEVKEIEELAGHKKPIRYVGLDCGEGAIRYVICGATNFKVGDLVVAALPGAELPGNFKISARETYGKTSNGMICSARELGISDEHAGIIVLPAKCAALGSDAIELLEIKDVVVDAAVNPDRGYALSIRGLARELSASLGLAFKDPVSSVNPEKYALNKNGIQVSITDPDSVSVAFIRTIEAFDPSAPVPLWMSRRIEKCGMRSISLAVDITNYVMLELGQPLHAFDAEKISGGLIMRPAKEFKTIKTLDGQERKLSDDELVVADMNGPLALAGVMGGASSEVTTSTKKIALEGARFDPMTIAKASRRHKLSSEASRRLERGVDPSLAEISTARAIDLMAELGGAKYVGSAKAGEPRFAPIVKFDPNFAGSYLGFEVALETVEEKLKLIGCEIEKKSSTEWLIDPPSWRADLLTGPDLVEEVARNIGFDQIPSRLPTGNAGARLSDLQYRKRAVANFLADNGFSEVYNYPFVNPKYLTDLGFTGDRAKAFRIANPMSEEFPDLRTHLLPGLLLTAQRNQGRGHKNSAIFEIGSVFRDNVKLPEVPRLGTSSRPSEGDLALLLSGVPLQPLHVGAVVTGSIGKDDWAGAPAEFTWSDAIAFAKKIIEETGNTVEVSSSDFAPWHPGRCAEIQVDGKAVAHAGELHPRVLSMLGLPARSCAFVVILSALPFREVRRVSPVLTMPSATQDLSVVVSKDIAAQQVMNSLRKGAGDLLEKIDLFDRYDQIGDGKISLSFTLTFRAADRTLTAEEVSGYRLSALEQAYKDCGVVIRS